MSAAKPVVRARLTCARCKRSHLISGSPAAERQISVALMSRLADSSCLARLSCLEYLRPPAAKRAAAREVPDCARGMQGAGQQVSMRSAYLALAGVDRQIMLASTVCWNAQVATVSRRIQLALAGQRGDIVQSKRLPGNRGT